jgi:hypothetical protein
MKWLAKRPMRACLSVKKAEEELGKKMMSSEEGLRFMRKQMVQGEV